MIIHNITSGKSLKFEYTKDTENSIKFFQSQAIKHFQKLADEATQLRNLPTPSCNEKNIIALAQCVIDFLSLFDHKAKVVIQSQRVLFYQMTLEDILPLPQTSVTWIPNPKFNGVHAEMKITMYGEKVTNKITFDPKQQQNLENGRCHLHISSFEEFLQWYNSTFGEGIL